MASLVRNTKKGSRRGHEKGTSLKARQSRVGQGKAG
jgi:hypothetical protein